MSKILKVDPGVWLIGLRICFANRWAALFVGKVGFVIWGEGDGKLEKCEGCGESSAELIEDEGMNLAITDLANQP